MPQHANCDVISQQNKKSNKKSTKRWSTKVQKNYITVLKVLSHNAMQIFVL